MNEKKTVLSVILGISLFTVITGAVGLLVDGLLLITRDYSLRSQSYTFSNYLLGAFTLVAAVITVVFLAMYIVKRKVATAIIVPTAVSVVFAIVSCIIVSIDSVTCFGRTDAAYLSYVAAIVMLAVTEILTVVSTLWLKKLKESEKAEESVKPDEPKAE